MTRIGVQLYSLRETPGTLPELLAAVGNTAFEGVEFAHRYADADTTSVADALDNAGLDVAGAHVGLDAMRERPARLIADYDPVGCSRFVLPHVPPGRVGSADAIDALAAELYAAAASVESVGGTVGYHNQAHDFVPVDGQCAFDALVEQTDAAVSFELDVGGAVTAGVDPVALVERYGDRIDMIHLKDVSVSHPSTDTSQRCVPIGTGDVDLSGVVSASKTAGVEWLLYENDDPEDPEQALDRGARTLARLR